MQTSPPADSSRRFSLPADRRLARRRDFSRVYQARCSVADARLVVYVAANDLPRPRVGLAVSTRLGGAVKRNRIKRLLREAFRHEQHGLPPGFDYVLVPRSGTAPTLEGYRQSLPQLASRALAKWHKTRPTEC